MYIKSKIALKVNAGLTGQIDTIIGGVIKNTSRNGDCTYLGANYSYVDLNQANENGENPIIQNGAFELKTSEEIEALYEMVKADIPTEGTEPQIEATKYCLAFRLEMLKAFLPLNPDLTLEDIEIV